MLYVAHHASLGNIAVELARSFIQPLTAIQTAADFVNETVAVPDGKQGLAIITQNVDRLRRQTQEFRKLSTMRQNAVETVRLDEYADQALDMLSVAIQNRGVTVHRDYITDCECVLLNGTALARTFLDLLLSALRSVEIGGNLFLRLLELDADHVAFEISYMGPGRKGGAGHASDLADPAYQLAERTIHSCGGSLNVEILEDRRKVVRIVLPRNATRAVGAWESIR
jgi:signal transduction histidine kinase